jgi:hypothetical protein
MMSHPSAPRFWIFRTLRAQTLERIECLIHFLFARRTKWQPSKFGRAKLRTIFFGVTPSPTAGWPLSLGFVLTCSAAFSQPTHRVETLKGSNTPILFSSRTLQNTVPVKFRLGVPLGEDAYLLNLARNFYQEVETLTGWSMELVPLPGIRSLVESNAGRLDGEAGRVSLIAETGDYPELIQVPVPILRLHLSAFGVDSSIVINGWESIISGRYRVGIAGGRWLILHRMRDSRNSTRTIEGKDSKHLLRLLLAKRVDIIIDIDEVFARTPPLDMPSSYSKSEMPIVYRLGVLESLPIFPYLHRKHSDKMKTFSWAADSALRKEPSIFGGLSGNLERGPLWVKVVP